MEVVFDQAYPFVLPKLPYDLDALASKGISEITIDTHYNKHHANYVKSLNALSVAHKELQGLKLSEIALKYKVKIQCIVVFVSSFLLHT